MLDGLQIARSFGILHRKSTDYLNAACAEYGMNRYEFVALMYLYDKEGISQDTLADLLAVDKSVVARTVKVLEEKSLIIRRQAVKDRRVKQIYLTADGWKLKDVLTVIIGRWIDFLKTGFTDSEIEIITYGMKKMAVNVEMCNDFSALGKGREDVGYDCRE